MKRLLTGLVLGLVLLTGCGEPKATDFQKSVVAEMGLFMEIDQTNDASIIKAYNEIVNDIFDGNEEELKKAHEQSEPMTASSVLEETVDNMAHTLFMNKYEMNLRNDIYELHEASKIGYEKVNKMTYEYNEIETHSIIYVPAGATNVKVVEVEFDGTRYDEVELRRENEMDTNSGNAYYGTIYQTMAYEVTFDMEGLNRQQYLFSVNRPSSEDYIDDYRFNWIDVADDRMPIVAVVMDPVFITDVKEWDDSTRVIGVKY